MNESRTVKAKQIINQHLINYCVKELIDSLKEGCSEKITITRLNKFKYGRALRSKRLEASMTLREAADLAGISAAFLCYCEHGKKRMAPETELRWGRAIWTKADGLKKAKKLKS